MDSFRKLCSDVNIRLQQEEAVILWLDGKKTAMEEKIMVLEERLKVLEEPQKLEKELLCRNNWALVQEKTLLLQYENLMKSKEEKDQLRENNNVLMRENKDLKKKIAKMESVDHADEDPEEVTLYNTDGEEITIEEWEARVVRKAKEARAARLEAKHRNTLPLACLNRIKRR
jgi:hypothetical protein